ncbi:MAG: putative DNA binding domain-containing protein, partial [Candidatus Heimdallarchaeota archaeon]|nr:putative DNA binding domain-containing protein [Candidatus Heimdallarchaeota archaeon]MCK5049845.1 putative DNA binding domain-containing protein [Candidatus Heimdallarchaeota archaeon]
INRFKKEQNIVIIYKTGSIVFNIEPEVIELIKELLIKDYDDIDEILIGQDETGKGEWYGPIVVVGVVLTHEMIVEMQLEGVQDSKNLNSKDIDRLFKIIKKINPVRDSVTINPLRFNELYDQFKAKAKTLNHLLAWGHSTVLKNIMNKLDNQGLTNMLQKEIAIVVDEFDRLRTEQSFAKTLGSHDYAIIQESQAEAFSTSVACASIIATKIRNKALDKIKGETGLEFNEKSLEKWLKHPDAEFYIKKSFLESYLSTIKEKTKLTETFSWIMTTKFDEAYVQRLVKEEELTQLDFKRGYPQSAIRVEKLIVAYANTEGGVIIFGITDEKEIVGQENCHKIEEKVGGLTRIIQPPIDVKYDFLLTKSNRNLLRVIVPKSVKVHRTHTGMHYKRVGSRCDQMTQQELEDLIIERKKI